MNAFDRVVLASIAVALWSLFFQNSGGPAQAEVAGMSYLELRGDSDFRRAVERIAEDVVEDVVEGCTADGDGWGQLQGSAMVWVYSLSIQINC